MPITAYVRGASVGQFFLANGARRPDAYRFDRNPVRSDLHEITFKTAAEFNAVAEDLLGARGNPPIFFKITPDPEWADAELQKKLDAQAAESAAQIAKLTAELETLRTQLGETQKKLTETADAGITKEQQEFLDERDLLLDVLIQHGANPEKDEPIAYLRANLVKVDGPPAPLPVAPKPAAPPKPKAVKAPKPKV